MKYHVREGRPADVGGIVKLLPRLADFEIPERRQAAELWSGDAELVDRWAKGDAPHCHVRLAVDIDDFVIGVAIVSLRNELLNQMPSSHLEVLAIDKSWEGRGVAKALLSEAQSVARANGAESMSLHVFATNTRARKLYEQVGFDGELIRYFREL